MVNHITEPPYVGKFAPLHIHCIFYLIFSQINACIPAIFITLNKKITVFILID